MICGITLLFVGRASAGDGVRVACRLPNSLQPTLTPAMLLQIAS